MNDLSEFLNKRVVLVYKENEQTHDLKGFLRGFDDNFVFFETDFKKVAVAIRDIVKIKMSDNHG